MGKCFLPCQNSSICLNQLSLPLILRLFLIHIVLVQIKSWLLFEVENNHILKKTITVTIHIKEKWITRRATRVIVRTRHFLTVRLPLAAGNVIRRRRFARSLTLQQERSSKLFSSLGSKSLHAKFVSKYVREIFLWHDKNQDFARKIPDLA